nr:A24 family peptidase [Flavonifractor sp. DFI.6.63]
MFLAALAAASAVDCRKRVIPNSLCLLTAAAGLISFSPVQLLGPLASLPLLIAALIQPECMGGGDIKLTAAAGFVLGFWQGFWGLALGLLLAVLYFCITRLYHKIFRRPHALTGRTPLPFGPFLSIGFAALYCFGG